MSQLKKSLNKVGQPRGSIIYTGFNTSQEISIELIKYNQEQSKKIKISSIEDLSLYNNNDFKWISICGLNNAETIKRIGEKFKISSRVLEDVLNVGSRPKVEFYDDYLILILKVFFYDKSEMKVKQEQVSFILFDDILVSFQEFDNNVFDTVKYRIEENKGLLRKKGVDYLLYYLVDTVVDEYFTLLGSIEEKIENIEDSIINSSRKEQLQEIYKIRKDMLILKTSIWPLENIIYSIIKEESSIKDGTKDYFKYISDHLIQIMEFIGIYREMILGMFDIYLSNTSNRMNQIMTTLTVFSTIFIPLTFLTGIYGMNFRYMPELNFKWSYPIFWLICLANILFLYKYFKNRNWI